MAIKMDAIVGGYPVINSVVLIPRRTLLLLQVFGNLVFRFLDHGPHLIHELQLSVLLVFGW